MFQSDWLFDERHAAGVDYQDPSVAAEYDARHTKFRDYYQQTMAIIEQLGIEPEASVVDLGCGTGAFAIHAASHCRKLAAVDISPVMLALLRQKAKVAKLTNITTYEAGFLTYEHPDGPGSVDYVVSMIALHHLPDFWKAVAVERIASMLRPGGKFLLMDVIFGFESSDYRSGIERWLRSMDRHGDISPEAVTHISREYSTFDWILEGMFDRSGLALVSQTCLGETLREYVVEKR